MNAPAENPGEGSGRKESGWKDTTGDFIKDKHGRPYLDAAAFDVLHALRFFTLHAGESPALLAALLIAWAIRGRP